MRAITARWAALLLASVVISGCATASSSRYRTLQEDWQSAAAGSSRADAGEGLFEGMPELSRGALVQQVLERNPTVRAAQYAWRAALARYPQATALDDPMLGGSLAPRSFGTSRVDEAYSVELSQALPFPGKLRL